MQVKAGNIKAGDSVFFNQRTEVTGVVKITEVIDEGNIVCLKFGGYHGFTGEIRLNKKNYVDKCDDFRKFQRKTSKQKGKILKLRK